MRFSPRRRNLLLAALAAPISAQLAGCALAAPREASFTRALTRLESETGGRLGVAAFDTGRQIQLNYRGDERFPMCSTFKVMAVSHILAREPALLHSRIRYTKDDLVAYSPITGQHLDDGMTIAQLCAAALQYSDNTAGNVLIKQAGGPAGVTAFARSIGDALFRLDRWETELNGAIPGDVRDTTTPRAMMRSLQTLTLGEVLAPAPRQRLIDWMLGNTTGAARIRAGVPADWKVADKTGAGSHGTSNTIAVLWPPGRPPMVLAIYFTQSETQRNDVVAAAARAVVAALA